MTARGAGRADGGNFLGAGAMLAWAAGFPAAELLLDRWDPVWAVTARVAFAAAPLLVLWLILNPGEWRRPGLLRGMVTGGTGFGGGALTIIGAQWFTDPVTVAIIAAASPLTAVIIEWLATRAPLTRPFALGLGLTVAGGLVASGGTFPANLGIGAALALTSCFLFSWGSYQTIRDLPHHSALGRATVTTLGAMAATAVTAAVTTTAGLTPWPADIRLPGDFALLAIYGTGAMAISQFLWIAAVDRLGISMASFHINIAPFYVMVLMLALGGGWSWPQAIGAAIVGLGVLVAQRP